MATKTTIAMSQQKQSAFHAHYYEQYQEAHHSSNKSDEQEDKSPQQISNVVLRPSFVVKPSVVRAISSTPSSATTIPPSPASSLVASSYFPNKPSVAVLNHATLPSPQPPPPAHYHSYGTMYEHQSPTMYYPVDASSPSGFHPMHPQQPLSPQQQQQPNYYYYGPAHSNYYYSSAPPTPTGTNFYSMYPSLHGGLKQQQQQQQQPSHADYSAVQLQPMPSSNNNSSTTSVPTTPVSGNNASNSPAINNPQRGNTPTSATTPTSTSTPRSAVSNGSSNTVGGYIKITRNIRATKVEVCEEPVEFPQSGVLYEFDVENWTNKMNFYDKIAYSFGVPSTQKVVFCHYLNCKVMHYERTCQGVYFCPSNENNSTCSTVRPCRFRFQTCPAHQTPLKKSSNCKFKLHFYVPVDKEDFRRLLLCLGDHSHALLENDNSNNVSITSAASTNQASGSNTTTCTPVNTSPISPNKNEEGFSSFKKLAPRITPPASTVGDDAPVVVLESGSLLPQTNGHPLAPFSYVPAPSLSAPSSSHHEDTTVYQIDEQQSGASHLYLPMYHNLHSNSGSSNNTCAITSNIPVSANTPIDFSTALQKYNPTSLSRKRTFSVLSEQAAEQEEQKVEENQNLLPNANSLLYEPIERTEDKEQLRKKVKTEENSHDSLPSMAASPPLTSVDTPTSASREKLPSIKDLFNPKLYQ